jgi:NTE family protein
MPETLDSGAPLECGSADLALVLGGGGALAAYQVGVLQYIGRSCPDARVPILTGVSAGAINAIALAALTGNFQTRVERLAAIWSSLTTADVFRVGTLDVTRRALRWAARLASGGILGPRPRSLLDTRPLRDFLARTFDVQDGSLPGIRRNLERGELAAVAVTASGYRTGRSVTWVQARAFQPWERDNRSGRPAELRVEHMLASASLPLLFPAVRIEGDWYGDGGVLLTSPLSPAIHLGGSRILAISTRSPAAKDADGAGDGEGYPPPAQIAGTLLNAVFLDQFDADALRVRRINKLIRSLPPRERLGLREVELFVLRPSADLARLANRYEARLPRALRFMTRGLGTRESQRNDLLSLLMFQQDFVQALIELGDRDAHASRDQLRALFYPAVESR